MLIVFFGLCLGVAFNMVIPGSLHIVTDAWESYENSTEIEELNRMYHLIRRLDDDDDDDDDDGFRRIIGVAICVDLWSSSLQTIFPRKLQRNRE